ncbi:Broad-range acid phosphatase DET1 [Tolypocladium ophioglossoides CBS 100239]|uniref:Broad-range acid phosphatase DET1 n=1 Tax=Tolypocladium ophioglossoides (strain CBS 100239) TaxID=1163406 RepID=A0A0L0NK08_TOLOC|nr:Broad-range acid phosphatase DET1 [Tolypocladium ophioglossoides CBS 100239]
MAKPRLIILIRHAQSEGNKNREIHQTIPDHRVKLTADGWTQAHDAGRRLRNLLRPDDTLHFFTSPYRRTRETTEGILATLTSDDPGPSPFRRSYIKVYEEPRLREQDFGNFQPCSAEMERMWQERADYGHFFYRIPNGESAADAYDRVSGFNESLWRQFGEDDFASVCVLVTHGLMSRVFLMKWYHFTVEYFEDLRNVDHCEFLIMRKQDNGKFLLENNLRTWSELRRERSTVAINASKDKDKEKDKDEVKVDRSKTAVVTRRWGGCPNGCNHTNHYKKRHDLEALRQRDIERSGLPGTGGNSTGGNGTGGNGMTIASRRQRQHHAISSDDGDDEQSDHPAAPDVENEVTRTLEEVLSSPDGTPSFITAEDRLRGLKSPHLHVGRDFGGTYSGHASLAGSDTDASENEAQRRHRVASINTRIRSANGGGAEDRRGDTGDHAFANRLGDAPPPAADLRESEDGLDMDMDDLDKAEREDRSMQGSVY